MECRIAMLKAMIELPEGKKFGIGWLVERHPYSRQQIESALVSSIVRGLVQEIAPGLWLRENR